MASNTPHYEADPNNEIERQQISEGFEYIIRHKGLNIVWGNDKRYWRMPNSDQREMPAELLQVCWLEVTCSLELSNPKKRYQIGFKVSLTSDAFGWNNCPVFIMCKWGKKGKYQWKKVSLSSGFNENQKFDIPEDFFFDVPDSPQVPPDDRRLYFGLYEVWTGRWKGGLLIHHAFVTEAASQE